MAKSSTQVPQEKLELYEKLIATHPEIERKGVSMPYTSVNGHMFSHLSKDGSLGIRLPKDVREAFLEIHSTTLFVQHGAVMKEYVTVPDELLSQTEILKKYLEISYDYVKSLKPKPTKKKKS
jgi:TfoX/Sxy family transcriptional regulator of competence genes